MNTFRTKKKASGTYVISQAQVEEFMSKDIDYNKLIEDCLVPKAKKLKPKKSIWEKEISLNFLTR